MTRGRAQPRAGARNSRGGSGTTLDGAGAARPMMVCEDGPYAGQWYYVTDWDAKIGAARWHVEQGCTAPLDDCPSRRALAYEPSGRRPLHPFYGFGKDPVTGAQRRLTDVRGTGYVYAPTRVTPGTNPGTL